MATDLRDTALNPNMPMRRDQLAQMTATPRSPRLGFLADAMMALKEFVNRVQVPAGVPLLGGEGVGSLLLGKAPEELVEMSYGNMPMRINPYAGQTASFVPEMKVGRGAQVADLLSLAPTPGGARAAAGLAGMADMGGAERALIGYHGTPHRFAAEEGAPLGRFRSAKIGTGEKAQAYGYGLYFAESPGVAKSYQQDLSAQIPIVFNGKSYADSPKSQKRLFNDLRTWAANNNRDPDVYEMAGDWIAGQAGDSDLALKLATPDLGFGPEHIEAIKELSPLFPKVNVEGSLYTVDIPDDVVGKMLDYDKPISSQPAELQSKLKSVVDEEMGAGIWDQWIKSRPDFRNLKDDLFENKTDAELSDLLRKAGIPGIRYLDRDSRSIGVGTRNIVVFPGEEQNVKILSRE